MLNSTRLRSLSVTTMQGMNTTAMADEPSSDDSGVAIAILSIIFGGVAIVLCVLTCYICKACDRVGYAIIDIE